MAASPITAQQISDSTNGAALLELLERQVDAGEPFTDEPWDDVCVRADPARVQRAAVLAAELPLSRLLELLLIASTEVCSFWDLGHVADRLEHRRQRGAIAEVVADRFSSSGLSARGTTEQWWWTDGNSPVGDRLGVGLDEPSPWWAATLPLRGLTTTSVLPDADAWISYVQLITGTWDLCFGQSARWRVEVDPTLPLYEVNDEADWVALVRRFPSVMSDGNFAPGSELTSGGMLETGRWKRRRELARIARFEQRVPGQRFGSRTWSQFLTPDWEAEHHRLMAFAGLR